MFPSPHKRHVDFRTLSKRSFNAHLKALWVANIYGYVLVSDGKHPGKEIRSCERAGPQIRRLQRLADEQDRKLVLFFDYKRNVSRLSDLPVLQRKLTQLKDGGGNAALVVDCLARLMQKPAFTHRKSFMDELMVFGDHLFGLRQRGRLSAFDDYQRQLLMTVPPPRQRALESKSRKRDTKPMTAASSSARKTRSKEDSRRLAQIRQDLIDQGQPATLEAVAREANARGYRNQRGKEWTVAAVSIRLAEVSA